MNCIEENKADLAKPIGRTLSYGGIPVKVPFIYYYNDGVAIDMMMEVPDQDAESYAREVAESSGNFQCVDFTGMNSPFAEIEVVLTSTDGQFIKAISSVCILWKDGCRFNTDNDENIDQLKWKQKYPFIQSSKHHVLCQQAFFKTESVKEDDALNVILKGRRFGVFPDRHFNLNIGIQNDVYTDIKGVMQDKDIRIYIDEIRCRKLSKRLAEALSANSREFYGLTVHYEADEERPLSLNFEVAGSENMQLPVYGNISEGKGSHGFARYAVNAGIVDIDKEKVEIILRKLSVKLFDDKAVKLV